MISRLRGTLLSRAPGSVEIETPGGVVYEVEVPLVVMERLPLPGEALELRTVQVVTETSVSLYGFSEAHERDLFQRLLTASGVGAKLALSMMSTFHAARLARALVEKDIAALRQIPGVGQKKAEKIALELADKVAELAIAAPVGGAAPKPAQEAVRALVALGFSFSDAELAVREVLEAGGAESAEELIRRALAR